MKRRYFLYASVTLTGAIALPRGLQWLSQHTAMATSPVEGESTPLSPFEIVKTEAEWRQILTPEQFRILRQQGTEKAGSSPLDQEYRDGTYHCVGCNLALFSSKTKYNSQTGWPSFYEPLANAVATRTDFQFNMERTEVHCARCGGHLGHIFLDGPPPTGKRYCINGVALTFVPA